MTSICSYLSLFSRKREEKIKFIMIQRLTAMNVGDIGNNQLVVKKTQGMLERFRPKDILPVLYSIRNVKAEYYEPALDEEIKRYESMTK